ncbi:unnamed protein product [Caenorhabditis auriculariae]|uniref:Ras-related protein Rab-3 n=1 Tax=Caenorhabditis auriculariae TaxID=2777116 RepID=A0A8S1H6Q5_9PELO|nr:unnamed protein product [Caenorhabditis auriculariae]
MSDSNDGDHDGYSLRKMFYVELDLDTEFESSSATLPPRQASRPITESRMLKFPAKCKQCIQFVEPPLDTFSHEFRDAFLQKMHNQQPAVASARNKKLKKSKGKAHKDDPKCKCKHCASMAAPAGAPAAGQPDQNFDYMFKLLIIGNSSVGKTSFLFRYCDDSFTSAFVSTVGIDFKVKTVFRGDKRVKLQIWDTAGQERYRTITTAYYRGAMGFILMYDITNEESFNSVQDWCTQIKTYSWENAQVVLVGNKCDMDAERVVSVERGRQLADQLSLEFFETSAKENINVKAVFEKLVEIICDKMAESLDKDPQQQPKGQRLDANTTQKPATQQCNC